MRVKRSVRQLLLDVQPADKTKRYVWLVAKFGKASLVVSSGNS